MNLTEEQLNRAITTALKHGHYGPELGSIDPQVGCIRWGRICIQNISNKHFWLMVNTKWRLRCVRKKKNTEELWSKSYIYEILPTHPLYRQVRIAFIKARRFYLLENPKYHDPNFIHLINHGCTPM